MEIVQFFKIKEGSILSGCAAVISNACKRYEKCPHCGALVRYEDDSIYAPYNYKYEEKQVYCMRCGNVVMQI